MRFIISFIIFSIALTILGGGGSWVASALTDIDVGAVENYTFERINEERDKEGLHELTWNSQLNQVAREHSKNMASIGFRHSNLNHYENIYTGRNTKANNDRITEAWLASPPHRRALLHKDITNGAVGIAKNGADVYATFMAD